MESFITGSHAYGIPTSKSDIDMVVFCDGDTSGFLFDHTEDTNPNDWQNDYPSIRFGNMNIIAVGNIERYNQWKLGTLYLKSISPVSRDDAIKHFKDRFTLKIKGLY
jgi:hypothetical protein